MSAPSRFAVFHAQTPWKVGEVDPKLLGRLSQPAKNILKRRAVDITSSLKVNVPNSCQDCCTNMWNSGASISEISFAAPG